ncbi:hypothetical protein N7468_008815 [Penicillium chermesinum]|uniref:Uncharacterized protein n=1 Tax=Penicillium chermesinum TaxID=63820 RepID=A0A9W9NGU3_9EURO|nr:uncharacterized protein N7468_008815 [Penicillium chermesinum]KAJ5219611.1 hypothetical protein N7468_008815 [Penicillium chermesinum]
MGTGSSNKVNLDWSKTPIEVPNEGVIVMGRMRDQDTAWVGAELSEWRNFIYTVDDTSFPRHTPKNKAAKPFRTYNLLSTTTTTSPPLGASATTRVRRSRGLCEPALPNVPRLPREIQPFRNPPKPGDTGEKYYAQAWKELFNNSDVPEVIGAPCCSQFAVSRDQILKRPLSDYQRMYDWVLNNDLPDEITSNIMEYSWHIIFGREPVFCPDVAQCYADVYGEEVITF